MLSLFRTTSCAAVRLSAGARAGIPGMRRFNATEAMDDYERKIHGILTERFHPAKLLVKDVSGGCGSMFAILVEADAFQGLPMIKQHRLVNEVLKDEIKQWHGLQLRTKAV